jgi:hypothetical protein
MSDNFWKLPYWLTDRFEAGDLSAFQFALICYLGGKGLDYRRVQVTLHGLARTFDKSEKWVSQTLRVLRDEARLIEYELRPGQRRPFVVSPGPALREGVSSVM